MAVNRNPVTLADAGDSSTSSKSRFLGAKLLVLLILASAVYAPPADQKWAMQFHYERDQSILHIVDFRCPSGQRCIAAGVLEKNNSSKEQGVVVLTSDGGKNWSVVDVKELPVSLFFLDDTYGWMVTDKGIWSTEESGRSWKKMEGLHKGILRVHFLNRSHGYAIGFPKVAFETTDGGKTWSKLALPDASPAIADDTVYDWIDFWGNHGIILGREMPRRYDPRPIWADPSPKSRRERQITTITLETIDGGKTWNTFTNDFFGHITRLLLGKNSTTLALVEYEDYYKLPSSVFELTLGSKASRTVFGETDRAVTDIVLFPNGESIIASIEPPGPSNQLPIPGKLKMLHSNNLKVWTEMDVDYRAVAQRAMIAAPDPQHVWVATDTGMILNLTGAAAPQK